jgi:hypothetical protein
MALYSTLLGQLSFYMEAPSMMRAMSLVRLLYPMAHRHTDRQAVLPPQFGKGIR